MTNFNIEPVVASERAILIAIDEQYSKRSKKRTTGAPKETEEKTVSSIDYKDFSIKEDDLDEASIDDRIEAPTVDINDFEEMVKGAVDQIEVVEDEEEDINPLEAENAR